MTNKIEVITAVIFMSVVTYFAFDSGLYWQGGITLLLLLFVLPDLFKHWKVKFFKPEKYKE